MKPTVTTLAAYGLAVLLGCAAAPGAYAQPGPDSVVTKRTVVVVNDGRVTINGKEVDPLPFDDQWGDSVHVMVNSGRVIINGKEVRPPDGSFAFRFEGEGLDSLQRELREFRTHRLPRLRKEFERRFAFPDEAAEQRDLRFMGPFFPGDEEDVIIRRYNARHDGELFRMEQETRDLARQAREADGSERRRLEEELQKKLETLFERKQEIRREALDRREEELQEERRTLDARERNRNKIVQERLRDLLGENKEMEW